jgi:hypothetical protein
VERPLYLDMRMKKEPIIVNHRTIYFHIGTVMARGKANAKAPASTPRACLCAYDFVNKPVSRDKFFVWKVFVNYVKLYVRSWFYAFLPLFSSGCIQKLLIFFDECTTLIFCVDYFRISSLPHWSVFFTSTFQLAAWAVGPAQHSGPLPQKATRRKLKDFFTSQAAY